MHTPTRVSCHGRRAPAPPPSCSGRRTRAAPRRPFWGAAPTRTKRFTTGASCPPRIKWGNTHGVVEDSQGNIYVHHTVHATSDSADSMVVFDRNGKFMRSWGGEFRGVAHGLHIRKEGSDEFLYLTVNAANPKMTPQPALQAVVVKATPKGEIVWKIAGPPDIEAYKPGADGTPKRYNPTNVAIAPNGDIYVGDGYGSSYVNQYNSKAEYIRTFGGKGSEAGQLNEPHGIWVDTRGDDADAGRGRPPEQPAPAFHARRRAHRLRPGLPAAVPFRRTQGRRS